MSETKDLVVPELGESITEAVIGRWLKQVGEAVAADEPVVDLETDKITVQLPAPASGALAEQRFAEGDTVHIGDVVGQIALGAAGSAEKASAAPAPQPAPQPAGPASPGEARDDNLRRLTPAQRRAARLGEPIAAAAPASVSAAAAPRAAAAVTEPRPPAKTEHETVKMSPLRRRIAERLVQVQNETASLTTFNEADMSAVIALRREHKQAFEDKHGVKLGFMSFFARACVAAAKLFPGLNAEIHGDSIVYKKSYHFGIAVSSERGLVVPVLRDIDRLSFAEIESGILDLATRARTGKLGLDDLTGGTFTITNGGIFGSMLSTPILNYPQTGILGMHNIVRRPVAIGDAVEVRPVMYIALTYDHRVVDGREAVQFLLAVKNCIEKPERLLLDI